MKRLRGHGARDEAWRLVAAKENGQPIEGKRSMKQVRFAHRTWTIVLDQYTVSTGKSSATYTRLRALLHQSLDFRFALYRESIMTRVGKFFGMRDVETGNPLLDRDYLVRTNDAALMRSLVASSRIAELLAHQPSGKLELAKFRGRLGNRPTDIAELRWHTQAVITDAQQLVLLVQTFRETLDRLARIGATPEAPVAYEL